MPYKAPLDDYKFLLDHVVGFSKVVKTDKYAEVTPDLVSDILGEAGKLCEQIIAPLQSEGDKHPAVLENGVVRTPPGYAEGYAAIAKGGWVSIAADPKYGGMGLPMTLTTAVNEMMAAACLSLQLNPLMTQGQIEALENHASEEIKNIYLPKLISGKWCGTMNLTEPQAGSDVGALRSKAEDNGDGTYAITGQKIYISWGDNDFSENVCHLVLARLPGGLQGTKGISLFLLDVNSKGVSLRNYSTIDGGKASELTLENVSVPKDSLLGEIDAGFSTIENAIDLATLGICAEAVGIMGKMNEMTLEYTKTREQFEQKLSQFQALQHRMVDNFMHYEQSKSLLVMCAAKMNDNTEDKKKALASLKYQIGLSGKHIGEESIQLHGGMGVTDEMHIGHYFKRLTTIRTLYGNSDYHLSNYASL